MEETTVVQESVPEETSKKNTKPITKKKTIKERQLGRIRRFAPNIDDKEINFLLDDPIANMEDLRIAVVEQDEDPKKVFNNPIFSKKLIKYIMEYKEETIEEINEVIQEAKEEISVAVDNILEDKKVELLESMLNKFEMLIEMMNSKIGDLDKIKDKYDEMIDDMENKLIEKTTLNKNQEIIQNNHEIPPGLIKMLRR